MRPWALMLAAVVVLAGCAGAPTAPADDPRHLFEDRAFAPPSERIDAAEVFAISDTMRRFLETQMVREFTTKGRQQGLFEALYKKGQLKLEYDTTVTRTAAQAFDARSGNCLSLVIMTAAFAKEVGLPVRFNSVFAEDTWSRSGDLYLSNGHVNISLGLSLTERATHAHGNVMTIDFLAPKDLRGYRSRPIGEATIVAMFMNNRAVENLAAGNVDDAYWWARAAIEHTPSYLAAYNTLGVVYLRRGRLEAADRVLAHTLRIEPENTSAMSNRVGVLERMGRADESRALAQQLAQIEPQPPFHFFDRGIAAMQRGDFSAAKALFAKEVARAAHYHEFHFWLALANMGLRDVDEARRHLKLALDHSTTKNDQALYSAKLDLLRERRAQ